jgi:WD40 repeat protein
MKAKILTLSMILCLSITYAAAMQADAKKPGRINRLGSLFIVPQYSLIVGACSSEPNGSIRLWSSEDGKLEHVIVLASREWAGSIAISHNGNLIAATLSGSNEIGCYSIKDRKWLWKMKWMEKDIADNKIQFTSDDKKIIVLGFKNILTYDAETGNILKKSEDALSLSRKHSLYSVPLLAISPNGRYAAVWQGRLEHNEWSFKSIFQRKWAVVWDLERNQIVTDIKQGVTRYKNCGGTFDPEEKHLLLGSMDGHIRIWSIEDQKMVREWKAYWSETTIPFDDDDAAPYAINSMTFSSDHRLLATIGSDKIPRTANIKIWDYSTNKLLHEFPDVTRTFSFCDVYPMAFSPDGNYFSFEKQGQLCLYDTQTWGKKWCVDSWPEEERIRKDLK